MANDNTNYVEVVGPDKKTYHFPKGTDKAAAVAYFRKKGIGVAAPATQTAKPANTSISGRVEPYRAAVRTGVTEGVKGVVQYPFQAAQLRPGEGEGRRNIGPTGRALLHTGEDFLGALSAGATARERARAGGEGFAGQTMATLENWPFVSEIAKAYERSGGSFSPDVLRSLTQTGTYFVGPKVAADTLGVTVDKVRDAGPPALRKYATKLDTRVLRQAESGAKDYKTSAALQVANEGIIGTIRSLPEKIERARIQKMQAVAQAAAKADASGVIIDITPDVQPIINDALRVMNQKGTLDTGTIKELRGFLDQLSTQVGPGGARVPRNLRSMKPSDALALTSHDGLLSDTAQFTKSRPDAVNNLARRIRYAANARIGQQLPDVMRMRGEESKLITARDAARDNYAQLLNGKYKMINGIIYGDIGYIPLWLALKSSGLGFGAATGGIVLLKALMDNAPSRTTRAALAARLANALERSKTALQAPQGAAGPQAGGSAITAPNAPTGPVTGPTKGLTAPQARLGPGGGAAPQTAGTAAGAALDTALFQQAKAEMPSGSVSDWAKRAQELKLQYVAQGNTSSAASAAGTEPDVEMLRRLGTTTPPEPLRPKPVESKLGTPEEQARVKRAMEGRSAAKQDLESGVGSKNKAMLNRLDTLLERQSKPKSAMDNVAIQREIKEIKSVLSGEAKGPELAKINKHIADRERLAQKRAEAKPLVGSATVAGEAVSQSASPETRSIALDAGYRKLATYDGGPEMVKALRKLAKDMQRVDPTYDEVTALTDAIQALKEVEGQ